MTIDPKDIAANKVVSYLQSSIVPRPIALVSSIDASGHVNLSPFSFFNVFSINPPILIFSPSRKVRDNTLKHTLENVNEVAEAVINIVNYPIVEQASLSSVEFAKGVNEFEKTGLTPISSHKVRPPRVKESPISFECKINQIITLGSQGGSGNLVVCEILLMHIQDEILNDTGAIDPYKLDAVARMGGDYYCRATAENIFVVAKPSTAVSIGFDQLPPTIRNSRILTGNDLGRLASVVAIPAVDRKIAMDIQILLSTGEESVHKYAQKLLCENKIEEAWRVLLQASL